MNERALNVKRKVVKMRKKESLKNSFLEKHISSICLKNVNFYLSVGASRQQAKKIDLEHSG